MLCGVVSFDVHLKHLNQCIEKMLDKNGLPLQFPPSAFTAFPIAGLDPRTSAWSHAALQSAQAHSG